MEGSYCGKTGTSTEVTLSLSQTGGNRLKIAGVRACRHVFPGQRHKGMSEPCRGRAPSLPFPARPGRARPGETRQGRAAGPDGAQQRPERRQLHRGLQARCSRRSGRSSSQRAPSGGPGGAGGARPGPSTDNDSKAHDPICTPLYLCAEVSGAMSSLQPCGSGRCRCGEAQPRGDTPTPQGPPGRARRPARPELRGALGLPSSAKGCEDGRAASSVPRTASGPTAGLLPVRLLPAGLLLPVRLLNTQLLPATRTTVVTCRPRSLSPPPHSPPHHGGRRYLSGRAASPVRMDRAAQWQPNKTPPATPPPPPARTHWPHHPPAEP